MSNPHVFFSHSAMVGAPVLSGTAGSLIAVLNACLRDGFGMKTVNACAVSGGIATLDITANGFAEEVVIVLSGSSTPGVNGLRRVLTSTATQVTVAMPGVADGVAAGVITAKVAGAGWETPFEATNLTVYRSADIEGVRHCLRVFDNETLNARVMAYESMTGVNAGQKPYPSNVQVTGGGYWPKADVAGGGARAWTLIADRKGFWLHIQTKAGGLGESGAVWGFGEFASLRQAEAYKSHLFCAPSAIQTATAVATCQVEYVSSGAAGTDAYVSRSHTGVGSAMALVHSAESLITGSGAAGGVVSAFVPTYPNPANNGLIFSRKVLVEPMSSFRGYLRGLLVPVQFCHTSFATGDIVDGQGDLLDRRLLAVKCGSPAATVSQGVLFFDITGPWG